jgi:glycosyltransferase involved in cell wall biosynthesis
MRIAYLVHHNMCDDDGIAKKVQSQVKEWSERGHEAVVFARSETIGHCKAGSRQFQKTHIMRDTALADNKLLSAVSSFKPDLIYFRYISWNATLHKLLRAFTSIAEVNSIDTHEFRMLWKHQRDMKALCRYLAYKYLSRLVIRSVVGAVTVTNEIQKTITQRWPNVSATTIPNGLRLADYQALKKCRAKTERRAQLFFIGTPGQPWQGVDLIVRLAKVMPDCDFHIVGENGTEQPNVRFYGYLNKDSYLPILAQCDVTLGTFGLHRKMMSEASPLKVREYLAHGYPCIIGYQDTAFPDGAPFLHRVKETESIGQSELSELKSFIRRWRNRVVRPSELGPIDASTLEYNRLAFMQACLSKEG